jgi:hypothetical protein
MKLTFILPTIPILITQYAQLKSNNMSIKNVNNQAITIIGKPINTKMGAAVQTENEVFYIRKLAEWPTATHNKIKVSGILTIENIEKEPNEPIKSQAEGRVFWIEQYKIE